MLLLSAMRGTPSGCSACPSLKSNYGVCRRIVMLIKGVRYLLHRARLASTQAPARAESSTELVRSGSLNAQ